ncbi:MAG: amino acid ABC transporter permease, partial [Paracoccaceae bacterium]
PILAFILLAVAVAPILFPGLPARMLAFSALYPFIGVWLMWGGSIWTHIVVIAGFAIGYGVFRAVDARLGSLAAIILSVLAAILWWLFLTGTVSSAIQSVIPLGLEPVVSRKFGGFMLSISIGVTGIVCSFPIGIVLALGRRSDLFIVKTLCVGFIEFIRGVPLITLLIVASTLLNIFLPPGTDFDIILRVMIMVTMFASAYMAEVIRGGLAALPKGQYEAADALGLDYWKAQRLIIMPQALKISIPGIVSTFIGLFKDTTLVSIISLLDPLGFSNAIRANAEWNGILWELYAFIAAMFWIFCFSMSRYSMYLERKLQTGHR